MVLHLLFYNLSLFSFIFVNLQAYFILYSILKGHMILLYGRTTSIIKNIPRISIFTFALVDNITGFFINLNPYNTSNKICVNRV